MTSSQFSLEVVETDVATAADSDPMHSPSGRVVKVNELPDADTVTVDLPIPERALAVGAHPDDIELGAGATLAKWAAGGCEVHLLVLTDGSKGTWDPDRDAASLVAARQEEQREAAHRLGSDEVKFFGWPDGELRNGIREQWDVCRWLRTVRPDVVLGHDPWRRYRLHPDHRNAGFLLTDSIVAARDPLFFADQDLAPHRPRALLLWEADLPNHVEQVDGFSHAKIKALLAHRSQYETTLGISNDSLPQSGDGDPDEGSKEVVAFVDRITSQLITHGQVGGVGMGEAFHLLTDL